MIALLLGLAPVWAHAGKDSDEDGWADTSDCGPDDPLAFPGARERCDGIDNDCDIEVDEDGACVDDVMPCYQVDAVSRPALDDDPCLGEHVDHGSDCSRTSAAGVLFVGVVLGIRGRRPRVP